RNTPGATDTNPGPKGIRIDLMQIQPETHSRWRLRKVGNTPQSHRVLCPSFAYGCPAKAGQAWRVFGPSEQFQEGDDVLLILIIYGKSKHLAIVLQHFFERFR